MRRDNIAMHINVDGILSSINEHEKKKELVNIPKDTTGSTHLDSKILEQNPEDNCRREVA